MSLRTSLPLLEECEDTKTDVLRETFRVRRDSIVRSVHRRIGGSTESVVEHLDRARGSDLAAAFDRLWLRARAEPLFGRCTASLTIADLFSGCGGLSLGAREACRALGIEPRFTFVSDNSPTALAVYRENFSPKHDFGKDIDELLPEALTNASVLKNELYGSALVTSIWSSRGHLARVIRIEQSHATQRFEEPPRAEGCQVRRDIRALLRPDRKCSGHPTRSAAVNRVGTR